MEVIIRQDTLIKLVNKEELLKKQKCMMISDNNEMKRGKQEGWTQEQYRDALREIQNEERQRLRNGERDLNSINRHNSIGGK